MLTRHDISGTVAGFLLAAVAAAAKGASQPLQAPPLQSMLPKNGSPFLQAAPAHWHRQQKLYRRWCGVLEAEQWSRTAMLCMQSTCAYAACLPGSI